MKVSKRRIIREVKALRRHRRFKRAMKIMSSAVVYATTMPARRWWAV